MSVTTVAQTSFDKFKPHPTMTGVYTSVNLNPEQVQTANRRNLTIVAISQFQHCVIWEGLDRAAALGMHEILTFEQRKREREII